MRIWQAVQKTERQREERMNEIERLKAVLRGRGRQEIQGIQEMQELAQGIEKAQEIRAEAQEEPQEIQEEAERFRRAINGKRKSRRKGWRLQGLLQRLFLS